MFYCTNCGAQLPDEANFCWKCGKPAPKAENPQPNVEYEYCEITLESVREKWGIYPREIVRYVARIPGQENFAHSPQFELTTFDYYGPNKKNPRHVAPFEKLVAALQAEGWVKDVKKGPLWFNVTFKRPRRD